MTSPFSVEATAEIILPSLFIASLVYEYLEPVFTDLEGNGVGLVLVGVEGVGEHVRAGLLQGRRYLCRLLLGETRPSGHDGAVGEHPVDVHGVIWHRNPGGVFWHGLIFFGVCGPMLP